MQEPVLFATSFRNNVKYGKLNANEDEIDKYSSKANITKFIEPISFKNFNTNLNIIKYRYATIIDDKRV